MAIVKVNYVAIQPGKRCTQLLRASLDYYALRPGWDLEDGEPRAWVTPVQHGWLWGRPGLATLEHDEAKRWFAQWTRDALASGEPDWRAYRVMLSGEYVLPDDEELGELLDSVFGHHTWLLTRHDPHRHPHAHVVVLHRGQLTKAELKELRYQLWVRERRLERERGIVNPKYAERERQFAALRRQRDRDREQRRRQAEQQRTRHRLDREREIELRRAQATQRRIDHERERDLRRAAARERELRRRLEREQRELERLRRLALARDRATQRAIEWEREHARRVALRVERERAYELARDRAREARELHRREQEAQRRPGAGLDLGAGRQ